MTIYYILKFFDLKHDLYIKLVKHLLIYWINEFFKNANNIEASHRRFCLFSEYNGSFLQMVNLSRKPDQLFQFFEIHLETDFYQEDQYPSYSIEVLDCFENIVAENLEKYLSIAAKSYKNIFQKLSHEYQQGLIDCTYEEIIDGVNTARLSSDYRDKFGKKL